MAMLPFMAKGTADMIKNKDLEMGDYPELIWSTQSYESLKLEKFPGCTLTEMC